MNRTVPLLGFCAYASGVGKTTLLTRLIPALTAKGIRLSVIKHAHHTFDIDHPGKDSYRLREAGATQMLLGSRHRWALMTEMSRVPNAPDEPRLADLVPHIDASLIDIILVEGFRHEDIPKIEIFRPSLNNPLQANTDPNIIAIATDDVLNIKTPLPILNLNDAEEVAGFVAQWLTQANQIAKL